MRATIGVNSMATTPTTTGELRPSEVTASRPTRIAGSANIWGPIIVEFTIRIGYAIFVVATLSFLGAGPQPPSPDWGAMVNDSYATDIASGFWWTTIFPALAIASLVIAVNLIADAVQSVLEG